MESGVRVVADHLVSRNLGGTCIKSALFSWSAELLEVDSNRWRFNRTFPIKQVSSGHAEDNAINLHLKYVITTRHGMMWNPA